MTAQTWGTAWLEAVIPPGAAATRETARGAAMARRGAVTDLDVEPGQVTADVAEDRVAPYRVRLRWPPLDARTWGQATRRLAGELRFTAALLEGDLPLDIRGLLTDAGVPILPGNQAVTADCTCQVRDPWCRHLAAVHHALAMRLDRDPLLLLHLRGRGRDALLAALRAGDAAASDQATVDLEHGLEGARGPLDDIVLAPAPPEDPAALLRHLGPPPGVDDIGPFAAMVERAAATAWRLAAGAGSEAAEEELLLAELRGQRTATAASLARALGRDVEPVRQALDTLFEAGVVLRTGSGERARYRAADA